MNDNLSYSFDFELTDDNRKAIEALLKSEGVRKYVIKLENGEYLDLVEFKEYERLNNVINELEKWLINETEKLHNISGDNFTTVGQSVYQEILNKLKELKEE